MRNVVIVGAGIVGLFNVAPVLTELARAGAARYDEVPDGFSRVGGLEVATTVDGLRDLVRRTATTSPAAR
ncbi:hypothetical protein ABZU76_41940 [Amycolatopsis sp. NPDC005232]|uniref:hypothetical protein n=1 Tax=Amycolatopsis sp. NPDC005232 TaxID=3157027 RepID=UPI0033B1ED92